MRRIFSDPTHMDGWRGSVLAGAGFLLAAAAFHFLGVTSSAAPGERALRAIEFAAMTFAVGLAFGAVVWVACWLWSGRQTNLEMRDTVLWIASLFGVVCVGFAVLS